MRRINPVAVVVLGVALVACTASWVRSEDKGAGGAMSGGRMGMGPGMGKMMHGHGGGMMGGCPMMGGGGMMGGCPMMGADVAVKVEKIKNGATLTLTSDDPKVVRRIQLRAEIMRLMNELRSDGGAEASE